MNDQTAALFRKLAADYVGHALAARANGDACTAASDINYYAGREGRGYGTAFRQREAVYDARGSL